jgi:hypothetical protein
MNRPAASVEALAASVEQHARWIVETAMGSPPGGGPAWDGLLRHYGIVPFPPEERQASVQNLRMSRGAIPGEVRAALDGLKNWALGQLPHAPGDPGPLHARLQGLVDFETQRYEDAIGIARPVLQAPVGPSLASIFANAESTSKEVPWANMKYKQSFALTCVYCGGPQEQPLDFMCKYCRRPIAGLTKPTT